MSMKFLDKVQAPEWFVENMAMVDKIKKDSDKIFDTSKFPEIDKVAKKLKKAVAEGASADYLERMKHAEAFNLSEKYKNSGKIPPKEVLRKMETASRCWEKLTDYTWARFRYENMENQFCFAAELHYDDEAKTIEIAEK